MSTATIARWFRQLPESGKLQCQLCPRACTLSDGERGFCFVRRREAQRLVTDAYGQHTGLCIDPIEKKPLFHFYPGSAVLSIGSIGCNLACRFCQNHSSARATQLDTLRFASTPERIAELASEHGCRSVAFTYNEPTVWAEYAIAIARACHQRNIKTVAVSNGYIQEQARSELYEHIDAANIDLKAFSDRFYRQLCDGKLSPVLNTLEALAKTHVWLELTTLLIPQHNDNPSEIAAMCDWIGEHLGPDVPLHFSAFHPDYKLLELPTTPIDTLNTARELALERGLHHVYTGNVLDTQSQSSYCHHCQAPVIERAWYQLEAFHLEASQCAACHRDFPGHFDPAPGNWGNRRLPIPG